MSFRICIIGNSHVAALKLAWSNRPPKLQDGVALTFFSAQNKMMVRIRPQGSKLVSGSEELAEKLRYTSGGQDTIRLKDYDAFVLAGSGFGIDVPRLSQDYGTIWPGQGENLMSRTCFGAAMEIHMDGTMALQLARMIRDVTDAPIVLVGAPFVSERELLDPPYSEQPWFKDMAFLEPFVATCRAAGERVAKRAGLEIVWQAEETYRLLGFTCADFNRNPVRFQMNRPNTPEFDSKHGNEDYGEIMLLRILAKLDALSGGRVLAD